MKLIKILIVSLLFAGITTQAQNKLGKSDDVGRIAICPVVGNIPDMPASAEKMLLNKMGQIASKNGIASYGNRFIMYPHVTIMSQDITPTAPPMHSYTLDVTLYIADNHTRSIFASATVELTGIGKNPTKAYIGAFKAINHKRPEIKDFIKDTQEKSDIVLTYIENDVQHQSGNTECGIYCLHFLDYMINEGNFIKYVNNKNIIKIL